MTLHHPPPLADQATRDRMAERYERELLEPCGNKYIHWWGWSSTPLIPSPSGLLPETPPIAIVGADPSLPSHTAEDISALHQMNVLCLNNSHLWCTENGIKPLGVVVFDSERFVTQFDELKASGLPIFAAPNAIKSSDIMEAWLEKAHDLPTLIPIRGIGKNGRQAPGPLGHVHDGYVLSIGGSVLFPALQVAYRLGARAVTFIGCGLNYDPSRKVQHWDGKERFWEPGAVDILPRATKAFEEMLALYRDGGRWLFNSTIGGRVENVPRITLPDMLRLEFDGVDNSNVVRMPRKEKR